ARLGHVVVDAKGASVDLRRPRHDKLAQQRLEAIGLNCFSSSIQGRMAAGLTVKGFSRGVIVISFSGFPEPVVPLNRSLLTSADNFLCHAAIDQRPRRIVRAIPAAAARISCMKASTSSALRLSRLRQS